MGEVHVAFPNMSGGWDWYDGYQNKQRTGFNEACKWVYAKFTPQQASGWGPWYSAYSIRIEAQCYEFAGEPLGATAIDEIKKSFKDTAEIAGSIDKIIQSGCNSVDSIMKIMGKIALMAEAPEAAPVISQLPGGKKN